MSGFGNRQEMGRPITIYDEGVPLTTSLGSMDFVGAGVTATGDEDVEVSIPGGAGFSPTVVQIDHTDNSYTPTGNGQIIEFDCSTATVDIDLSGIADPTGWQIACVASAIGNDLTFDLNIDGAVYTFTPKFIGDGRTIYYDGSGWKTRVF